MTTFTLQDLTPQQQTALDDQALQDMAKLGAGVVLPVTKEEWMAYGMSNPLSASVTDEKTLNWVKAKLDAPEPQPTPDLDSIINTICTQLQLLSTIIRGERAQDATPPEGNQSLQETIALTLQQADWFKEMVEKAVDDLDMVEIAKEAVEGVVESEVEHYFDYKFSPEDHFDFGDAVSDAVDDRLDDIVREKIDECIEEVVAEKLSEASVSISF